MLAEKSLAEQLINRLINPLGLVLLTRERIQETLDDAATRGRITRSDANELVTELVRRGRCPSSSRASPPASRAGCGSTNGAMRTASRFLRPSTRRLAKAKGSRL
jgi:hypothetical protein